MNSNARALTQWHRGSLPASEVFPVDRFIDQHIFASKEGGYGCLFQVTGIDPDGLTLPEMANVSTQFAAALRTVPERTTVFQYALRKRGWNEPQTSLGVRTQERSKFLRATANFGYVELYLAAYVHPPSVRLPGEFEQETARTLKELKRFSHGLPVQLADVAALRLAGWSEFAWLFSYLLNLQEPRTYWHVGRGLDHRLPLVNHEWHGDLLKVGKRYAQAFSLLRRPKGTRPNLWGELLSLDCDLILCSKYTPQSSDSVRREINRQEGFTGIFKNKIIPTLVHAMSGKEVPRNAASVAAEKGIDGFAKILMELDGTDGEDRRGYGHLSLFGLVHSADLEELSGSMNHVHKIFRDPSEAEVIEETIGAMSAFYSLFPGAPQEFDVRRSWFQDLHYANTSFLYQSSTGNVWSDDLDKEYLLAFETRQHTPYFYDPFFEQLGNALIIGAPRRGKSMLGNAMVDHEQKYAGFTTIYDVGGSYNSTALAQCGSTVLIGSDGPRFAPFAQELTREHLIALLLLVRALLRKGGVEPKLADDLAIVEAIERVYALEPDARRLGYLMLPTELQPGLRKWTAGGIYESLFDNLSTDLDLTQLQAFDFAGIGKDDTDLMEPVLFWLIHLKELQRSRAENLLLPKHDVFDEAWQHIKDPQMWRFILRGMKTGGKQLGRITLILHHIDDMGEHAELIKNACPTVFFLGDPLLDREQYRNFFDLNEQQLQEILELRMPQFALKRPGIFKVLELNLDEASRMRYSTKPKDIAKWAEALRSETGVTV